MIANQIRVKCEEAQISVTALVEKMPDDLNIVAMSFIEAGKVLPTKGGLAAICKELDCTPTDIYELSDIDLISVCRTPCSDSGESDAQIPSERQRVADMADPCPSFRSESSSQHEGEEQLRVWMRTDEKAALVRAIKGLGYHSIAEWLREKYRETLRQYIALKSHGTSLHNALPLTTQNQHIGS